MRLQPLAAYVLAGLALAVAFRVEDAAPTTTELLQVDGSHWVTATGKLKCHLAEDIALKQRCCTEGLDDAWLSKMPRYTEMTQAAAALDRRLSAGRQDDTGELSRYADATKRSYAASLTKHVLGVSMRDCLNSAKAFTPYSVPALAQQRKKAAGEFLKAKAALRQSTTAASTAAVKAKAAQRAYSGLVSAADGSAGLFDAEKHMTQANDAVTAAELKRDAANEALVSARASLQTAEDAVYNAQDTVNNKENDRKTAETDRHTHSMEFEKDIKDLQASHATAEKTATESGDGEAEGVDIGADPAVEAAMLAVEAKKKEYADYNDGVAAEIKSLTDQTDLATQALDAATDSQKLAKEHKEKAAVTASQALHAVDTAVNIQGETHALLQENQQGSENGEISATTLKTKAAQAEVAAKRALDAQTEANEAMKSAGRLLRHAVDVEERGSGKKAFAEKDPALLAWDKTVAANKYVARHMDAAYKHFAECAEIGALFC